LSSSIRINSTSSSDPIDQAIVDIENKFAFLKLENAKFFENKDIINDELIENERINKVKYII
jgi:hypothetical protein